MHVLCNIIIIYITCDNCTVELYDLCAKDPEKIREAERRMLNHGREWFHNEIAAETVSENTPILIYVSEPYKPLTSHSETNQDIHDPQWRSLRWPARGTLRAVGALEVAQRARAGAPAAVARVWLTPQRNMAKIWEKSG